MRKMFNRLPPTIKDALIGLVYALLITLILLLSYGPESAFRYLSI